MHIFLSLITCACFFVSVVAQPKWSSEPATLETPTGRLAGTILTPEGVKKPILVLLIAGSGPTNRDGNSPLLPVANNSLRYLAEGLAERGFAVLRYDKRGVGESVKALAAERDIRFDNYIDDAVAWGEDLRKSGKYSGIAVAGHSEGSLIGMVAAQKLKADFYVSISGVGRKVTAALREQLKAGLDAEAYGNAEKILVELEAGRTVAETPPSLASLFRASVQPYLISWFKYEPEIEIRKLKCPVLIAHGTTDIQVKVLEAEILAKARPDAKLLIIDKMNHVLKDASLEPEVQKNSYRDPALPVDAKLVAGIADFLSAKPN